jgi:YHS domain-containing protein
MVRLILTALFVFFLTRALWRLLGGVVEGLSGPGRPNRSPQRGVQMVRDPVCGTFVVPERAVALTAHGRQVYFCSSKCRDTYRTGTA